MRQDYICLKGQQAPDFFPTFVGRQEVAGSMDLVSSTFQCTLGAAELNKTFQVVDTG